MTIHPLLSVSGAAAQLTLADCTPAVAGKLSCTSCSVSSCFFLVRLRFFGPIVDGWRTAGRPRGEAGFEPTMLLLMAMMMLLMMAGRC